MKIFGWAADSSGCAYYRIQQPLRALAGLGHDVSYGTRMLPEWRDSADVVIGQRVCNKAPSSLWSARAAQGKFLVYELDDDLFNIDPSNKIAYYFFGRQDIRRNMEANMRAANRLTVSTEPLAEVMRAYNDDVRVCPNTIPDWLLDYSRPTLDNGKVTIGWCGSATHEMDFAEVQRPLRQLLKRDPGVEFHCIGANYAQWMKLPKDQCRFTPWIPDVEACFRAYDYDIGIAPLRPHAFNKSKSHIKVLECAALGIPVVASNVYPYANFVKHGETGFIARYDHEWPMYLRTLVNDAEMRAEMGANARKQAEAWTTSRWAKAWEEALTDAV